MKREDLLNTIEAQEPIYSTVDDLRRCSDWWLELTGERLPVHLRRSLPPSMGDTDTIIEVVRDFADGNNIRVSRLYPHELHGSPDWDSLDFRTERIPFSEELRFIDVLTKNCELFITRDEASEKFFWKSGRAIDKED